MPLKHTVTELKLKNGGQGLIIDVPDSTVVSYRVGFRAGSYYARTQQIEQVAHIMEHMAFGASKQYPTQELFSQEFTKNGAYHNAHTGEFDLWYDADAPSMEWQRILRLEQSVITQALYKEETLAVEKRNVREELLGYTNSYYRQLWQLTARAVGLERWDDAYNLTTIDPVTLDDIKEHYARTHTARNMRFVLVGDFSARHPEIEAMLESWQLASGERLPIPAEQVHRAELVHIKKTEVQNLYFDVHFYVNRALSRSERNVMMLLGHILTGTFHSRIFGTARTRGIAYYHIPLRLEMTSPGISDWELWSEVGLDHAADLFKLIVEQLQAVVAGTITEQELEAAKEYRLGSLQMSAQTVSGLSEWYRPNYFDTGEITVIDDTPGFIHAVTLNQIQSLAREFLTSGIWSFGGLGNITKAELAKHYQLFADFLDKGVQ